jgi:hypothetical protein
MGFALRIVLVALVFAAAIAAYFIRSHQSDRPTSGSVTASRSALVHDPQGGVVVDENSSSIRSMANFQQAVQNSSEGSPDRIKAIALLASTPGDQIYDILLGHLSQVTNNMETQCTLSVLLAVDEQRTVEAVARLIASDSRKDHLTKTLESVRKNGIIRE